MCDSQTAHCRLCAYLRPYSQLINLQMIEKDSQLILEKLSRLNVNMPNLYAADDPLPKTICFTCIDSLNKAYNFVINIDSAQRKLMELTNVDQNIKQEVEDLSCESVEDTCMEITIKTDDECIKLETDLSKTEPDSNNLKCQNENESDISKPKKVLTPARTWRDYSWKCAYCETLFPNVEELTSHSMQHHRCCNAYRCTDCNIRKLNLDKFIIHVKRHRKYLKLSCYKCYEVFPRPRHTIIHQTTHINSEHICSGCNKTFLSLTELKTHSEAYNKDRRLRDIPDRDKLNNLTCILCQKTFKYKSSLITHFLTHSNRERTHTCDKCGKCFLNKENLKDHIKMVHEDSRPHQCEICKQGFRTAYILRSHISIHDGAKPFSCEQCGRCFRLEKHLRSHSIVHTDSLPHVCKFCNKGFRFRQIMLTHLRQHTGEKPYSCQICQRHFTNWANLHKHMKNIHSKDIAKKKHTPDGLFPINPTTGEVVVEPQTDKTLEWKKKILDNPKCRRKKGITKKSYNTTVQLSTTTNVEHKDE